jgi:ELWxxDGT repeat protein
MLSTSGERGNMGTTMQKSLALFGGLDDTNGIFGRSGLWVTDGTSAGTWEISVAGANPLGFHGGPVTTLGNKVLFIGSDANNQSALWVTDGTSPGTSELAITGFAAPVVLGSEILFNSGFFGNLWASDGTPAGTSQIPVAGAASGGLNLSNLTVFGSEVLFSGQDAAGHNGLWVTDGTAAGTSELTVAGAASAGLSPSNLTVFGNKAVFAGTDAAGKRQLWVTDGTGAGTSELSVAGTSASPIGWISWPPFIALGSEVLFVGIDASNNAGLWVTDGTSAGTSEISVPGAFSELSAGGVFELVPPNFFRFGNKVLFEGTDNTGHLGGLWITDGTSAGTSEILPAGASPAGILTTVQFPSFFAFGSEVLFEGFDASQAHTLWVTDGTSSGTSELSIAGSNTTFGIFNNTSPGFALFGTEVLFDGQDSHGLNELWVTDGTAAGTSEISVAGSNLFSGLSPGGLIAFTQSLLQPVLSNAPGGDSYVERAAPITLAPSLHITDDNSSTVASATVAIVGGTFANDGDVLAFSTAGASITAAYDSASETLTLTGTDTLADYQAVLQTITFANSNHNPTNFGSNLTRTLTWVVNDGAASNQLSVPQTTTLSIAAVNEAPTLSNVAGVVQFTEEGGAVTLSNAVTITDPDSVKLANATVSITGGGFTGDVLSAAGTASISVSYNSATETLTLTGTDTFAHYQAVLDTVTFNAGENPTNYGSNPSRTLVWTVNDGSGTANGGSQVSTPVTSTISVTNVNDPPSLSNVVGTPVAFGRQTVPLLFSAFLTVSDPDNLAFAGASVAITGGTFAGDTDVLSASTAGTNISASYNPATETLTLSGTDTLVHYKNVLGSVTFSAGANPTNFGSNTTRTFSWVINDGAASNNLSAPVTSSISIAPGIRNDFDANGAADLILQNTDGTPQVWLMNDFFVTVASMTALMNPGAGWHVAATGDFNRDGTADLLWQNNDGTPAVWEMNGTSIVGGGLLPNPGASWHVIATSDFNADGNIDILWQNTDGTAAIWLMNGTTPVGGGVLPINPGVAWHVMGAGDVNHDGKSDILWQNNDGMPAIWEMNGTSVVGGGLLINPGASWRAVTLGDFNGDGKADILWQNTDGAPAIWELNGTNIIGGGVLANPGASWHVVGTSDFNRDGRADIIWQNTGGLPEIWAMNGTSTSFVVVLPNPGAGWQVKDDGPIPPDQMGTSAANASPPPTSLHFSAPDLSAGLTDPTVPHASGNSLVIGRT